MTEPSDLVVLQSGRLTGGRDFDEQDDELRPGVPPLHQRRAHFDHVVRQLLRELAARRVEQTLLLADLSARELPQPGVPLVHGPPAHEIAPVATNHGSQHANAGSSVLRRGRPLLYLVAVTQALYEPSFPCYVIGDVPEQLTFLLIADEARHVTPAAVADEDWPRKAYVTREVKHRLHQQRFRYLVLAAYRDQCAMCRLRHIELLDAAHILPDRDERGNPEVTNGLSLCRIHYRAYDVDILGVDPDYRIHLRRDVLDEIDGPMLRHGLQELHGERIQLPRSAGMKPRRAYLAERFESFNAV